MDAVNEITRAFLDMAKTISTMEMELKELRRKHREAMRDITERHRREVSSAYAAGFAEGAALGSERRGSNG